MTNTDTASAIVYFNVIVLIVQAFQKVHFLHAVAPQGDEPPFAIIQGFTLVAFVSLGWAATRRFRDRPAAS